MAAAMDPKTLLGKAQANKKTSVPENVVEVKDTAKPVTPTTTTVKNTANVVKTNTVSKVLPVKNCDCKNDKVARLNTLVVTWENLCNSKKYAEAMTPFKNMVDLVLNNQDDKELLDAWRKLFIKYRDTHLSTEHALAGFRFISSEDVKNRISIAYMLMYELVNPKRYRKKYDFEFASQVLSNPKCKVPNGYVAYVVERMR